MNRRVHHLTIRSYGALNTKNRSQRQITSQVRGTTTTRLRPGPFTLTHKRKPSTHLEKFLSHTSFETGIMRPNHHRHHHPGAPSTPQSHHHRRCLSGTFTPREYDVSQGQILTSERAPPPRPPCGGCHTSCHANTRN